MKITIYRLGQLSVLSPGPSGGKPNTPATADDESIKEGDQIFATCFHNEPAEVCATQHISQSPCWYSCLLMMHVLSALKQTALTLQPAWLCPHDLLQTKSGTWWPSSQKASTWLNRITRSMTRRCLQLSVHCRNDDTSWKGHNSSLRFGLTTKTWSTSGQHRNSTGCKHNGPRDTAFSEGKGGGYSIACLMA
jgi:hypothetical protein